MHGEQIRSLPKNSKVRLLVSDEDKSLVYRFRYEMHYLKSGKQYPGTDHTHRVVQDELDGDPRTRLYATFDEEGNVTGTGRLTFMNGTPPPSRQFEEYQMSLFPEQAIMSSVLVGGLVLHPDYRASDLALDFYSGTFLEIIDNKSVVGFGHTLPKLFQYFQFMGYQSYGVQLHCTHLGTRIAFILNVGDKNYLRDLGSPYYQLIKDRDVDTSIADEISQILMKLERAENGIGAFSLEPIPKPVLEASKHN
jgi:hypothetical protein